MGLFRRKGADKSAQPSRRARRGAVSVSVSGEANPYAAPRRGRAATAVVPEPAAAPAVERYEGTVIEPAATAAQRISSAADVDPNVKKYGAEGVFKGGGGGFGGAGTM